MTDPVTVGMNNFKWLKDDDTYGISLFRTDYTYGTYSMGQSDGTPYQVPSGHKLIILNIFMEDITEVQIHDSASSNSASGTLLLDTRTTDTSEVNLNTYIEIASSRYVNVTVPDPKSIFVNMLGVITSN